MRCGLRGILTVAGLSAGLALGGCGSGGSLGSLDPSDWFDFNKEKPIPGERRAVFPEGVPGVPQGVPPELVRGNQPPPTDAAMVATAGSDQPAAGQSRATAPAASTSVAARTDAEAKSRPATKQKPKVAARPKPKPPSKPAPKKQPPAQTTAKPAKPEPVAQPAQQGAAQPSRAQDPIWGQHPAQGANTPWPAQGPQHTTTAPWPDAPSPNRFSR